MQLSSWLIFHPKTEISNNYPMVYYEQDIQGRAAGKTESRMNRNLPSLVLSVIIYSLQHWLTHQRSIIYPSQSQADRDSIFFCNQGLTLLLEITRNRDITCWGTFSVSPLWSSYFTDNCHKQHQIIWNWRTSSGQLQTVFKEDWKTIASISKDVLLRDFSNSPKHLFCQINRNGQCTH